MSELSTQVLDRLISRCFKPTVQTTFVGFAMLVLKNTSPDCTNEDIVERLNLLEAGRADWIFTNDTGMKLFVPIRRDEIAGGYVTQIHREGRLTFVSLRDTVVRSDGAYFNGLIAFDLANSYGDNDFCLAPA